MKLVVIVLLTAVIAFGLWSLIPPQSTTATRLDVVEGWVSSLDKQATSRGMAYHAEVSGMTYTSPTGGVAIMKWEIEGVGIGFVVLRNRGGWYSDGGFISSPTTWGTIREGIVARGWSEGETGEHRPGKLTVDQKEISSDAGLSISDFLGKLER